VQPRVELAQLLRAERDALHVDRLVAPEPEAAQAAVGGDVLVLLADRLAEDVDLDPARLLRELLRGAPARRGTCGTR
jgi:hypothetical protein